ncbi:cytochrome c biogenesis protein CcdA [Photobacterium galatheae]|uniref:Cytochrome C biogenesis protein n=1 Tax=Photobacterium galatheae TaxID=1654360 RepID=A0A066RPT0_9GAMM|nr:cytochrome c biogenesis protein CcdA [Photobacterium galatheae]KDM92475.1 cytochrome C biogenesis protein [Photobacterium galatheae]MCM0147954.1 sulfite exporter TauE/SafE family protein [Photobacterium galatheae]
METAIQTALFNQQFGLWVVGAVFLTGLLTSLTPCVYPMLPITVSVVGSQATGRWQALGLSVSYVLGLAVVYALLGMLAATTGQLFGVVASHPVTLFLVGVFCFAMAAWMVGWLRLPGLVLNLPAAESRRRPVLSTFVAGACSGLVMAPCTSPVLGMLLMYVASSGNAYWAALLMFVFALGMSALLVLAGTFGGLLTSLPRSGQWMNRVKWGMAALMAGAGTFFFFQIM